MCIGFFIAVKNHNRTNIAKISKILIRMAFGSLTRFSRSAMELPSDWEVDCFCFSSLLNYLP